MSRHVKGRKSTRPAGVPDVRFDPCPKGGIHQVEGVGEVWACQKCDALWAELDAQVRANRTPKSTGTKDCIDCGASLVSDRRWAEAASEIRQQWRNEGKASRVGDRCARCSRKGKAA